MNKSAILKIAGILLVPFLVMLIGAYFLYPQLNEERYNEIVNNFEEQQKEESKDSTRNSRTEPPQRNTPDGSFSQSMQVVTTQETADSLLSERVEFAELTDSTAIQIGESEINVKQFEQNEIRLHGVIDSLYARIDQLEQLVDSLENPVHEKEELEPAEFTERVKSLLNLEEDELSPILKKMNKEQIVRLYHGGGTIQRQKILRSLDADKAAELMTEIML